MFGLFGYNRRKECECAEKERLDLARKQAMLTAAGLREYSPAEGYRLEKEIHGLKEKNKKLREFLDDCADSHNETRFKYKAQNIRASLSDN